jgi:hypothetical protein
MAEFQPRWGKNKLLEHPQTQVPEVPVRENFSPTPPKTWVPEVPEVPEVKKSWTEDGCEISELSPSCPASDRLLSRLQAGSEWLTTQHQAWLEGKQDAVSDERFSVALAAWGEMERSLRWVFGYEGYVFGPDRRCPEGATVTCNFCVIAGSPKKADAATPVAGERRIQLTPGINLSK